MTLRTDTFLLAMAIAAGSATAQTTRYLVSPSQVNARTENPGHSSEFGAYPAGRHQRIDGNLRGRAMTIKGLSFRPNFDSTATTLFQKGLGRTWSSVRVQLASGNLNGVVATFDRNLGGDKSQVFQGRLSWPDQDLVPRRAPQDWVVRIPFASSFSYDGRADLVVDVGFSGGVLNGRTPWIGKTPYLLDTYAYGQSAWSASYTLGKSGSAGGCSAAGSAAGAYSTLRVITYGPNAGTWSNSYRIRATLGSGPKSTPGMYLVSAAAAPGGVRFPGVTCNEMYFQPLEPLFLFPKTTNVVGGIGIFDLGIRGGRLPYDARFLGVDFVAQFAWSDTRSQQLKISAASWTTVPAAPAVLRPSEIKLKSVVSARGSTSGIVMASQDAIPLIRYHY